MCQQILSTDGILKQFLWIAQCDNCVSTACPHNMWMHIMYAINVYINTNAICEHTLLNLRNSKDLYVPSGVQD